jgi:hypothetical protein
MLDTLTYDYGRHGAENGWVSRYSFIPDWMVGLNSNLYTFKGGELYLHDSDNVPAAEFYGVKYPVTVTTEFNDSPLEKKVFDTIHLFSDDTWDAEYFTDLNSGLIEAGSFVRKESDWYAYIRREDGLTINDEDATAPSTQGVGVVDLFAPNTITFSTNIDTSMFATGDRVYVLNGSAFDYVGNITAYTTNTIDLSGAAVTPANGDFVVVAKNRIAESNPLRGYFMNVKLTNTNDNPVELFAVGSRAFKSYP